MPIYDLRCEACNLEFERTVKHGEPITCPACGKDEAVKRLPSVFAGYSIGGDNSASTGTPRALKLGS